MAYSILTGGLILLFIGLASYFNRVRGTGSENKPWFLPNKLAVYAALTTIYIGLSFVVDLSSMTAQGTILGYTVSNVQEWMLNLPLFLFLWLCFSFGWGKYFPHGQNKIGNSDIWKEKEFLPADLLANKIVGKWNSPMPEKWVRKWQTVAMGGRFGFTFGITLFPYLAAVNESFLMLLATPASFLVGLLYRIAFNKHTSKSLKVAEHLTGAFLGFLLALPLLSKIAKRKDGEDGK